MLPAAGAKVMLTQKSIPARERLIFALDVSTVAEAKECLADAGVPVRPAPI